MSQIFEIVQSLSGQRNAITIPVPYLDFFPVISRRMLWGQFSTSWSSGPGNQT